MTADIEAIRKRHATLDADKRAPAEVETAELCVNLSYAHADRAALLATLDAMTAQVTWRDIKTAPKNRKVLIYCPWQSGGGGIFIAEFRYGLDDEEHWRGDEGEIICGDDQPTHWLPLPAPPVKNPQEKVNK